MNELNWHCPPRTTYSTNSNKNYQYNRRRFCTTRMHYSNYVSTQNQKLAIFSAEYHLSLQKLTQSNPLFQFPNYRHYLSTEYHNYVRANIHLRKKQNHSSHYNNRHIFRGNLLHNHTANRQNRHVSKPNSSSCKCPAVQSH